MILQTFAIDLGKPLVLPISSSLDAIVQEGNSFKAIVLVPNGWDASMGYQSYAVQLVKEGEEVLFGSVYRLSVDIDSVKHHVYTYSLAT